MTFIFTKRAASATLLTLLSLTILFHVLVMLQLIPFDIVWGGRLTDEKELYTFEIISIVINLLMLLLVLIKVRVLKWSLSSIIITVFLWMMFGLFALNTLGNLLSKNTFEKMVFTPLTLLAAICCFVLARSRSEK
jgi:hypothetical protein